VVCVKGLLPQPNPLMNKIEFTPYEAKNHYPVAMGKLPPMINIQEYHVDKNNMLLMD
jgi:hypothetical protein